MKRQQGVDSHSGLSHSAVVTPATVHDKHALPQLRHGREKRMYGDNAYRGRRHCSAPRRHRQRTSPTSGHDVAKTIRPRKSDGRQSTQSTVRAKVEPVFAVVKRLWGFTNVHYRRLIKNANPAFTALALANLFRARGWLTREMRPYWANCGAKVPQPTREGHEKPAERRFSTKRAAMGNLGAHKRELFSKAFIKYNSI